MTQIKDYYSKRIYTLSQQQRNIRNKLRTFGWLRLLAFFLLAFSIFGILPKILSTGLIASTFLLLIFFILIKQYLKLKLKLQHIKALITNAENELQALDHNFTEFCTGEEFTDPTHSYSFDMDIFGEGSVFQYINRTVTCEGKSYLASLLQNETIDPQVINERQKSIRELLVVQEKLQDFRANGALYQDNQQDLKLLNEWISKKAYYIKGKFFLLLTRLMPSITILAILLAVFIPIITGLPILLYLINLFIVSRNLKRVNEEHGLIGKRLNSLKKYASLIEILETTEFQSPVLQSISKTLISGQSSAARSIHKLSKLVSAFDNRMNFVAALFLEGLFLWDIQCMIRLEKWRLTEGSSFHKWIDALAEFDVLTSLAIYAFNHKDYIFPEVVETPVLEAEDLGHVLIPGNERVCNNFRLQNIGDYKIITGANMAGKSTFLRTITTSMIIAMTGAPVCASTYRFCPMPIFSSMRTNDSLNKHESYFYAELKRLKEMLDRLRSGEKLFIILDEILKGTNSHDKQKGSYAAMEQIIKLGGTGIIATHDLELAQIEKDYPERIQNLCFEIEIDQAKISFDYKLKEGITTKMNASLLMQQMGIIE